MQQQDGIADRVLASLASRAHGVVARAELLEAGVSPETIRQRLQRGSLIRVHRGVYRVGHLAPSREAVYMAAVKACGFGSLLAGRAAGHLWSLLKGPPPPPEVITSTNRAISGIVVHRARVKPEACRRVGIPVTTVPRTLVDLASSLPVFALTRACHEADVLHKVRPEHVEAVWLAGRMLQGRARFAASSTAASLSRSARSSAVSWSG